MHEAVMPLQAASAKEASAASREALEVSRLEGEELCRQLSEMQERLSTTEAQLQACQKAASSKLDMAGAAWPGLSSLQCPCYRPVLVHISTSCRHEFSVHLDQRKKEIPKIAR